MYTLPLITVPYCVPCSRCSFSFCFAHRIVQSRECRRGIYTLEHHSLVQQYELSIVKVVDFKGSSVSGEEEERVSKSSWNRNMEESVRSIFSSTKGGGDSLYAFPMPPIPIVLRYSFPFLLAWTITFRGETRKYQCIGINDEVFKVSREEDETSV